MNTKPLIDSIVRQTTVLIAQLSTAAGVRAPLAHLADQVFLSLSREIEAQGVGRRVVADMFGMALRGYQKKTQRIAESQTEQGKTLLEAVLEYLDREGGATRRQILERFRVDGERETVGVLNDLVGSGLVHTTGTGRSALYGVTTEAERQRLTRQSDLETVAEMAWGAIYRQPGITREALTEQVSCDPAELSGAIERLVADGRVRLADSALYAAGFQIPAHATTGWESAVFDHFQAVATAIANKLHFLSAEKRGGDWIGGTTLRFELCADHPYRQEVLGLLQDVRRRLNEIWARVSDYNDEHPIDDERRFNVVFYFGQNVEPIETALNMDEPGA
jgi:hypothetical protein